VPTPPGGEGGIGQASTCGELRAGEPAALKLAQKLSLSGGWNAPAGARVQNDGLLAHDPTPAARP
jgi:hypothetical protein